MIHHISIAANNPYNVAQVFAEIMKGRAIPFPPNPGSYIVLAFDEHGTAIEVYPLGSQIKPGEGEGECTFFHNNIAPNFTEIHAAISVSLSQKEIEQIGIREGWRVVRCSRDSLFDVIEFWVENRVMIEFLTPEMASSYIKFATQPEILQAFAVEPELASV